MWAGELNQTIAISVNTVIWIVHQNLSCIMLQKVTGIPEQECQCAPDHLKC